MNLHLRTTGASETARDFLRQAAAVADEIAAQAPEADMHAEISADALERLNSGGFVAAPLATQDGGGGLLDPERVSDLFYLLRLLGGADLSVARVMEGHINAVALVYRYGAREQIGRFAQQVRGGALSGVWGADDARGLKATKVPAGWALEGRKVLASGAGLLRCPLVTATTDQGQVLFELDLKPGERADISGWTAQGMRASATGAVDLTGMVLRSDQMIGSPGDFTRQPAFSGGAWRFCAVHLGAMEQLVDLTREHLVSRQRDGDAYQLERMAHCIAATTTARLWIEKTACALCEEALDAEAVVALANLTRMVTERAALDVLEAVHRSVGLMSFIRPNPIERIARDLSTYLRQPAPDVAMANGARWVLQSPASIRDLWPSHAR